MSFHEQSFAARFGTMGDTAEAIFDEVCGHKTHELGLNRPNFSMREMTPQMRYTPDRLTADAFVECMGIGRDGILKIKDEKIEALTAWRELGPVKLFVYDQKNHSYFIAQWVDWLYAIERYAATETFPEGKTYKALYRDHFPGEEHEVG